MQSHGQDQALPTSNVSGQWDNYHGSDSYVRLNWEEQFARGRIGTSISSFVPIRGGPDCARMRDKSPPPTGTHHIHSVRRQGGSPNVLTSAPALREVG